MNTLDTFTLIPNVGLEEFPKAKMVRILGNIFMSPSTGPAGASGYYASVGLTRNANANTVLWNPSSDLDHKWAYWNSCFMQIGGTGAADANAGRWAGYFRFDVNMRTAIRFEPDEIFNIHVSNSAVSAAGIQWACFFRFLMATGSK